MTRTKLLFLLLLATLRPFRTAMSQTEAAFPDMDELRAWLKEHHPQIVSGESGLVNAAVIVIDTNAHYVRSIAYRLTAVELADMSGAATRGAGFEDDAVSKNLLNVCFAGGEKSTGPRPICVLDGSRVPVIDALRFLATRDVDVLKSDAAVKRFGTDGVNGAVIAATDTAALARFKSVGATPENFMSFEERRIRRNADGLPVIITVLMLRP